VVVFLVVEPNAATVFRGAVIETAQPDAHDAEGFDAYMVRYERGLAVERAAVSALDTPKESQTVEDRMCRLPDAPSSASTRPTFSESSPSGSLST
jgi:hypothetical protein